jgi:hypothetical protein
VGVAAFLAGATTESVDAGAANDSVPTAHSTTTATTAYVDNAINSLIKSTRVFNVVSEGADPTGSKDSTAAIARAQSALKAAGGGELYFPPGGRYRFQTGVITRTKLADAKMSINAAGATLAPFGAGIAIDTTMTDPNYWSQPITPPMSPVVFSVMDCSALTAGAIGVRHSITVGAYYDGLVHNAAAFPDSTWPIMGHPGARGWQLRNTTDTNGVARWTEQTVFGPNSGVHNCYIGIEFDAANGGNSFGYTRMNRFVIECNRVRQRGVVVRGSGTVGAQLYGSQLNWQGNNDNAASTYVGTYSGSANVGSLITALEFSSGSQVPLADGEIVLLKDSSGQAVQAVMVRGANPVGTTSVATYQFTATNGFVGGTVETVPAACVIGWPGKTTAGWSAGTATDPSNLRRSTLDWEMESGGSNLPVRTCALFVSSAATLSVFGHVDLVTYSSGLVQNYGTVMIQGSYEGHVSAQSDLRSTYLGAAIPGVESVCLAESIPRLQINDNSTLTLNSGVPVVVAIAVAARVPIRYLGWYSGSVPASGVQNHWMALLDRDFNQVATTMDLGSTIDAKNAYGGPIALSSTGAVSSYTPPDAGVMYIALCVVAESAPSVSGAKLVSAALSGAIGGGPLLCAMTATAQTTPPPFPFTYVASSNVAAVPYVWVAGSA